MSAARKLARKKANHQNGEDDKLAASATVVSGLVFEKPPPNSKHLARRIAICTNFVYLCRKHKCPDLERALKMVTLGAAQYDEKRDGYSDWMRWVKDVEEQRRAEESAIVIPQVEVKA